MPMRWLLLLAVLVAACKGKDDRSTLEKVLARGELLVGTEPQFPPFEELFPKTALYLLAHYEKQSDLGRGWFQWDGLSRKGGATP